MSMSDKIKHAAEEAQGKGKETAGKVTDDEKLENEGRADQLKANLKQAGDSVKEAFDKGTGSDDR
ncbi:CsbD family protein [Gryllotalpicola ginsengisoli]|uniref:CsbD family protein n=1 Tax=Gryllotalpicola ginsengisoli TaxID=444608 RepID=UPI0003B4E453|nr:CsbD family protein [Gryllotalpicola ginsengisoli]